MLENYKFVDLTHTISKDAPTWDGSCGFVLSNNIDYENCTAPDLFRVQKLSMNAGIGTHMDAPAHCVPDAKSIESLELEDLIVNCVVIDVSDKTDENYIVMPEVVEEFEEKNGKIKEKSFVIFYTGWDKHWDDKEKYHNDHVFPSIHVDTAKLLLERNIAGLGTDTLSADTGANGFPVHQAILGAGKYLVENIANASVLPPNGAKILVLPIKIKEGTEAPIRLLALI